MTRRLSNEEGFTLIELLVVILLMGFIVMGVADLLVSGTRAQADTQGRIDAQQGADLALSQLEYEVRCSSSGTRLNSGAGVALTIPSQCSNAHGTVSWCVSSGVLSRYTTANCTGTGQIYVSSITSATPFQVLTVSGDLPQLQVDLTVNETGRPSDAFSVQDTITFQNGTRAS